MNPNEVQEGGVAESSEISGEATEATEEATLIPRPKAEE